MSNRKIQPGTFHEILRDNSGFQIGSPRAFGLTFATVFLVIGGLPLFHRGHLRVWSLVVGSAFLLAALAAPRLLVPLNRVWSLVGSLLHRVTTPILMALLFVLAVTPVALLRRAVGEAGLALRFDAKLRSYWITRAQHTTDAESLKRQF